MPLPTGPGPRPSHDAEQLAANRVFDTHPALPDFMARVLDKFGYLTPGRVIRLHELAQANQIGRENLREEFDILQAGAAPRRPRRYGLYREATIVVTPPAGSARERPFQVRVQIRAGMTAADILAEAQAVADARRARYGWGAGPADFYVRSLM